MSGLPDGWTIERVRQLEPSAILLDVEGHALWVDDGSGITPLPPAECIVSFGDRCLVLVRGADEWWMGQLDETDASILCWATYGEDLGDAIRGL